MKRSLIRHSTRCVLGLLLFLTAVDTDQSNAIASQSTASITVRLSIGNCFESDPLTVAVNRNFRSAGTGISGGGITQKCHYSYAIYAVRIDRNRANLYVDVTVDATTVQKHVVVTRGKNRELTLQPGVTITAFY